MIDPSMLAVYVVVQNRDVYRLQLGHVTTNSSP
jgi:hypothetical protein